MGNGGELEISSRSLIWYCMTPATCIWAISLLPSRECLTAPHLLSLLHMFSSMGAHVIDWLLLFPSHAPRILTGSLSFVMCDWAVVPEFDGGAIEAWCLFVCFLMAYWTLSSVIFSHSLVLFTLESFSLILSRIASSFKVFSMLWGSCPSNWRLWFALFEAVGPPFC